MPVKLKQKILTFSALSLLVIGASTTSAFAMRGPGGGSDDTQPTSTSGSSTTETSSGGSQQTQTRTQSRQGSTSLNKAAENEQAEIEKKHTENELKQKASNRSPEEKKKQCVAHQKGLNRKFASISTNVQRIQDKISKIYSGAQQYATTKSLNPEGYQALVQQADAAKAASQLSINALKQVTPASVDCNNPNVSQDVAKFKVAAQDTRQKLKAYKTSVKAVLNILELPQGTAQNEQQSNGANQ